PEGRAGGRRYRRASRRAGAGRRARSGSHGSGRGHGGGGGAGPRGHRRWLGQPSPRANHRIGKRRPMSTASSFLARMAEASRERVRRAKRRESERALLARAGATAPPPPLALKDFDVIAELKLRSPAAGALTMDAFDWPKQVKAYADGGAAAVSVLTEPTEFQGELTHLEGAAKLLRPFGVPTMRKDFLTDPYQVLEARAAGAGGVL